MSTKVKIFIIFFCILLLSASLFNAAFSVQAVWNDDNLEASSTDANTCSEIAGNDFSFYDAIYCLPPAASQSISLIRAIKSDILIVVALFYLLKFKSRTGKHFCELELHVAKLETKARSVLQIILYKVNGINLYLNHLRFYVLNSPNLSKLYNIFS